MDDHEALLRLDLPDRIEAPRAARQALTALNGSLHLISSARLADAQLLVTELVANAVRHGGADGEPIHLTVHATAEAMRVEVRDGGAGFDVNDVGPPSAERSGGWGLQIVAGLAHRWGVEPTGPTTVWFEIDRPQQEQPLDIGHAEPQ